jgi:hypothetical protein
MQPALQAVLWSPPPTALWLLLYQKFVPPTLFHPKTDYIYDHRILHENRSDSMKIGAEMLLCLHQHHLVCHNDEDVVIYPEPWDFGRNVSHLSLYVFN